MAKLGDVTMSFLILATIILTQSNGYIIEENSDPELFQGDMKLTPLQRIIAENGGDISLASMRRGRGTLVSWGPFWLPTRLVPYDIHKDLAKFPKATFSIMKALREWETYTCIRFVERTDETAYIHFITNCSGCWSSVGRQGDAQSLCLDRECFQPGTVIHEIAHAMGICHEQSRPDRDDYVEIWWNNIKEGEEGQFVKFGNQVIDSMGFEYDYLSVMQYSSKAFSKNKNFTMIPKKEGVLQLGQRLGFSEGDILQFSKLYKCDGNTTRPVIQHDAYELTGKYDCTFDKGDCHYIQDDKDDYDWTGRIGPLINSIGGPNHDHTTNRLGRYMSVDSIPPSKRGDTARLISAALPATKATCLTFFYHMFTPNRTRLGTLNLYVQRNCSSKLNEKVFSRTGSQENEWLQESVFISSKCPYKIIFEGIRGWDYQGDIAIDDVSFTSGRCLKSRRLSKSMKTTKPCHDIADREAIYCEAWAKGGLCELEREDMIYLCPKTCMYCT